MVCHKIEKVKINEGVVDILKPALFPDEELIIAQIKNGVCELFKSGKTFFVTRLESNNKQLELVVVALAGSDLKNASTAIYQAARNTNCKTIRFHTKRKGLARILKSLKPEYFETVYKIGVS